MCHTPLNKSENHESKLILCHGRSSYATSLCLSCSEELVRLCLWGTFESSNSSSLHAGEHICSKWVDRLNIQRLVFKSRLQCSECTCVCCLDSQQSKLWFSGCAPASPPLSPLNGSYLGFPHISMGNYEIHLEHIEELQVPVVLPKASGNTQQH